MLKIRDPLMSIQYATKPATVFYIIPILLYMCDILWFSEWAFLFGEDLVNDFSAKYGVFFVFALYLGGWG